MSTLIVLYKFTAVQSGAAVCGVYDCEVSAVRTSLTVVEAIFNFKRNLAHDGESTTSKIWHFMTGKIRYTSSHKQSESSS